MKTVVRDGEGPGEARGGIVYGSVIDEELIIKELSGAHKAYTLSGGERVLSDIPWGFRSAIKVRDGVICAAIVRPGGPFYNSDFQEDTVPKFSIVVFEIDPETQTWDLLGTFYQEDIMHDFHADIEFGVRTNLFPIAESETFYRIPYFASPTYQVMDYSSQPLREFPIPHPFASQIPKSPFARLQKIKEGYKFRLVQCATVDEKAHVYFLLSTVVRRRDDGVEDLAGRLLVHVDARGIPLRSFLMDRQLKHIVVNSGGTELYAVDVEKDQLLKYQIPSHVGG